MNVRVSFEIWTNQQSFTAITGETSNLTIQFWLSKYLKCFFARSTNATGWRQILAARTSDHSRFPLGKFDQLLRIVLFNTMLYLERLQVVHLRSK